MNTKTKALFASAIGLGLTFAGIASAQTGPSSARPNSMASLVSAIATKFSLSQADVQAVFDQEFTAKQADMEAKMKETQAARLAKAVSAGSLTQTQADLIIAKQVEIRTSLEALKGKTGQELKDAMTTLRDSIAEWATANNIPKQYLEPGFGGARFGHGRMGMKKTQ